MPVNNLDVLSIGILVADFFPEPMQRLPEQGELMLVDSIVLSTGGCAANTAAALSRLGKKTGVVGKVGSDVFGRFIIEDLKSKSIDVSRIAMSTARDTSKTIILPVVGDDRRYLHLIGANAEFCLDDIDLSSINTARALYVGGYLGMPGFGFEDLKTVLDHAKRNGLFTALDVIVSGTGYFLKDFAQILPLVDAFLPNEDEARLLTGEADPEKQADTILGFGSKAAVITMGARGVLAKSNTQTVRSESYPVSAVDGSGAGDAFDAGFIAACLDGKSLEYAVKLGSAMGASCVRKLGCTAGLFTRKEAEEFIRVHENQASSKEAQG